MDVGKPVQIPMGTLLHHRGQVDWVDQLCLAVEGQGQPPQGGHDLFHGCPVVFPPVAGDHDHLFPLVIQLIEHRGREAIVLPYSGPERVDHRISGDEYARAGPLRLQVPPVALGGQKWSWASLPTKVRFISSGKGEYRS